MRHDRRLAAIEQRLFAAQKQALAMLTTDDLRLFVLGYERILTGSDITPEEDAVKRRWLALVQEQLHARPADALQESLAARLRPQRPAPPWAATEATTTPADMADVAPVVDKTSTPPAAFVDTRPRPALRKLRQMARDANAAQRQREERRSQWR